MLPTLRRAMLEVKVLGVFTTLTLCTTVDPLNEVFVSKFFLCFSLFRFFNESYIYHVTKTLSTNRIVASLYVKEI